MIRIVNLNKYKLKDGEVLIKVDRSTILGNPYIMEDKSDEERNRVCDVYERYFAKRVKHEGSLFYSAVSKIKILTKQGFEIALGCWCAPQRCHAETIMRYIMVDKNDK